MLNRSEDGYEAADAALYDMLSQGVHGDVAFYLEEARRSGGPVLDVGCGTGRILIPLAEAGIEAFGIDLSLPMLELARAKLPQLAPDVRARITTKRADMTGFALKKKFPLVLVTYRTFMHAKTPADQKAALACFAEHLQDGGRLVLDVFEPRPDPVEGLSSFVRRSRELVSPATLQRVVVTQTQSVDRLKQVVEEQVMLEEVDDAGTVVKKTYRTRTQRYFNRYEMEYLLALAGFDVEALHGDFARGPWTGGEQVWIARRR